MQVRGFCLDFDKPFPSQSSAPTGLAPDQARAALNYAVSSSDAFYGDGTLTITNNGTQDASVYLPFGSVFPPANSADQRLIGYSLAAAQPVATTTAGATSTVEATTAATSTVAATAPAAATSTTAPTAVATETTAPTETAAPTMAAAPTMTPATPGLPTTDAGDSGLPGWPLLFGAALFCLVAGPALLRRSAPPA